MGQKRFVKGRQWCSPQAKGVVLEIGFGAGANLPYYTNDVSKLFALEPSKALFDIATTINRVDFEIQHLEASAENIPLGDNSIDSIVCTWTLCSVGNVREVTKELYRVLKPTGKVFFIEHGKASSAPLATLQNLINNLWKRCAGGCNLNRTYFSYFTENGFTFQLSEQIGTEYSGIATK